MLLENGLAGAPRTRDVVDLLDDQRKNTEVTRAEMFSEAVRDCERVNTAIEGTITTIA